MCPYTKNKEILIIRIIYPRTTLSQAPNTAMQICRNKGATKKASRITVYDKVLKF